MSLCGNITVHYIKNRSLYNPQLFKDAEKVLAGTEQEEVVKLTGERQVSDLNRNEVATMIKSIR